jgi:chromosomal replication initiator protein
MYTFTHWVTTPENHLAHAAVRRVARSIASRRRRRAFNPLFLYGPAGTGKTHLVNALVGTLTRQHPELIVCLMPAADSRTDDWRAVARDCDLLVVEDVQHLPPRSVESLVQVIDDRRARGQPMVFTASRGVGQLTHLPARVTSRLGSGLQAGLEPLGRASRLLFIQERARRRGLAVGGNSLAWLADHVGGSARQLDGALKRLQALARLLGQAPDAAALAEAFRDDADAARPSVQRIIERVGGYFHLEPAQLRSRRRGRHALLPRQVGMYLARRLTPLSLEQIGAHFGGRDHSTVLHACRKVEMALARDTALCGAVRQLHADLG